MAWRVRIDANFRALATESGTPHGLSPWRFFRTIPRSCDNPKNEIRLIRPQARAPADSVFRVDGAYYQTTRVKRNLRPFVSICLHLRSNSFFTSTDTVPNDPMTRITGRGAQNGGDDFASGLTFVFVEAKEELNRGCRQMNADGRGFLNWLDRSIRFCLL
jgi:hypothetical protein